jgi:hypothetical protein
LIGVRFATAVSTTALEKRHQMNNSTEQTAGKLVFGVVPPLPEFGFVFAKVRGIGRPNEMA